MALIASLIISSFTVGASLASCPNHTITAVTGDNVSLVARTDTTVDWNIKKVDIERTDTKEIVSTFKNGKPYLPLISPQYRDRTRLNTKDLRGGVMNLTISNVTPTDSGQYRFCDQSTKQCCVVTLAVGDALKQPFSTVGPSVVVPSLVVPSVIVPLCFLAAAAATGFYLWKSGRMKTLMTWQEATDRPVSLESRALRGEQKAEDADLRECLVVEDQHPSHGGNKNGQAPAPWLEGQPPLKQGLICSSPNTAPVSYGQEGSCF